MQPVMGGAKCGESDRKRAKRGRLEKQSLNPDISDCFRQSQPNLPNEGPMPTFKSHRGLFSHAAVVLALLALGAGLSGCAEMSDGMTSAFADPARYDLYECKQLEPERKSLSNKLAELQGLMAKAETGVAGPVVAELAYRNEYIAVRGQSKLAEEAWQKNRCKDSKPEPKLEPPVVAPAPMIRGARSSKSGSSVH